MTPLTLLVNRPMTGPQTPRPPYLRGFSATTLHDFDPKSQCFSATTLHDFDPKSQCFSATTLRHLALLLLWLLLLTIPVTTATASEPLRFRADSTFVVAHFSDLHLDSGSPTELQGTLQRVEQILQRTRPDFVVFNGDIVTDGSARDGWQQLIKVMDTAMVPFTVTMGNHDPEVASRADIYHWLSQSAYFRSGTEVPIPSLGTHAIYAHSGSATAATPPQALLYTMDSGDYAADQEVSHYAWIPYETIADYRRVSSSYRALCLSGHEPIPALMFFHIPLPEYRIVQSLRETFFATPSHEGTGSSAVNSGLMASLIECGDVMGVFAGHDHDNDFVGQIYGIALGYGRVGGDSAYGTAERGARLIRLYQGERRFDTAIVTAKGMGDSYHYPSGINGRDEREAHYLPAIEPDGELSLGLRYYTYSQQVERCSEIGGSKAQLVDSGTTLDFDDSAPDLDTHYASVFEGYIHVPHRGVYRLYTISDDGSTLHIDDQMVVDNDGSHSARKAMGTVALEQGWHRITVRYFQDTMGTKLEVGWSSKELKAQRIPTDALYHTK